MEQNFEAELLATMDKLREIRELETHGDKVAEAMKATLEMAHLEAAMISVVFWLMDVEMSKFLKAIAQRDKYNGLWAIK